MLRAFSIIILSCAMATASYGAKPKGKPVQKSAQKAVAKKTVVSKTAPARTRAPASASTAAAKPEFSSMAKAQKEESQEAYKRQQNYRNPSSLGDGKALKVTGQNRNLNMSLILGGKSDKVDFGEVRENYRREVIGTDY